MAKLDPGPFSVKPSKRLAMWAVVSDGKITTCDSYSKVRMEQVAELLNKHYAEKKEASQNASQTNQSTSIHVRL